MSDQGSAIETSPQPNRRGAFFLLFFSLMAIGAGNTMLIAAVIPPLTRTLELPDWMAGAIFSLSALCWSLSSPFWGKRSNQYGRRRIASFGLAGYAVSMFLLLISSWAAISEWITAPFAIFACLALSRSVFGLIGSGSSPSAQAYVADRTEPSERQSEIAFVTSGFSFGTVVGPAFA
ncbi:MAG: MFS transporter, partial [Pseudomonadota bacterium]